MKIEELDKNFASPAFNGRDIDWYEITDPAFSLYGVFAENGQYVRVPASIAQATSEGVAHLAKNTAGGRVRFATDSPFVALKAEFPAFSHMAHITDVCCCGFDIYRNGEFTGSFRPDIYQKTMEGIVDFWFGEKGTAEITVNFPTYNEVKRVFIGLKKGSALQKSKPYRDIPPFVYYGSSITQGGCASRSGNIYQSYIERRFDVDYINLGFSGNGRGETVMAEYIASLDMSVFILDYDHNAPDAAWLKRTHEPFFQVIRKAHPDLPILILSRFSPKVFEGDERTAIIRQTYENALAAGDKNVWFIPGNDLIDGDHMDACTVDMVHPNDLGFYRIGKRVGDALEEIMKQTHLL